MNENSRKKDTKMPLERTNSIILKPSPEERGLLEEAARIKGVSLREYVVQAALESAKMDIEHGPNIVLLNASRDIVLGLHENPPQPNEALRKLFQ